MPKFLQRRGKLSKRSGGDGAPVSELLWAATLRSKQSLCEPEATFRGDTGTARRAPRLVLRSIKKRARSENIVQIYVKPEDAALSENNGGWSETSTKESRAAESKLFLRFAPKAALMASVLGNNSRASGAQSGQVKCKLKRRRRRRSKRKGTTLQPLPVLLLWFLSSVSRGRAHLGGASERAASRSTPAPLQPLVQQLRGGFSPRILKIQK